MPFQLTIKHNGAEISFTSQDLAAVAPTIESVVNKPILNKPVKRVSKTGKRLGRPPKVQPVA